MKKLLCVCVALVMVGALLPAVAAADELKMEEERAERRQEVAKAIATMSRLMTTFDYISFYLSGPAVVLEGFTTKPTIRENAEDSVKALPWVNHVVNKIEQLSIEPTVNEIRGEVLSIVQKASPQSFPQGRAYIRIKVDKDMNVALAGWADPGDKVRLEAAVVRIQNLPLVKKVDNHVLFQKLD